MTPVRLATFAVALCTAAPARADYSLVDLTETYGITAAAFNTVGQYTGSRTFPPAGTQAFRFDLPTATLQPLGTLGGPFSFGLAINSAGWVAGTSRTTAGPDHAFLSRPGIGMTDLGTLPGRTTSSAAAVNGAGVVVGASGQAFAWTEAGGMVGLGTLGGATSAATAVSENGFVVGFSSTTVPDQTRAFGYRNAVEGMFDLGSLFADGSSRAAGVNDAGLVVGRSWETDPALTRAFVWTQGAGMADIGTLGGDTAAAAAVSAAGLVVGSADNAGQERRAFVWDAVNGMQNLNELVDPDQLIGRTLVDALAVNDLGQILARSAGPDGVSVVLLSPPGVPPGGDGGNGGVVPAPAGLGLGVLAAGLLWRRFRRSG